MVRLSYDQLKQEFIRILLSRGFEPEVANDSATIFADTTLDGVYSHGVNRFPKVISFIDNGYIDPKAKPTLISALGAIEKWDGNLGMGNINAKIAMDRTLELAKIHGIGAVALRNTNHWMRGSTYGIQAADQGFAAICWTNTLPNMPAWGSTRPNIGNNPLVIAIPRQKGMVLFDAAMSQFSYGKMETTKLANQQLPFPGGYNLKGELTTDPAEILQSWRVLPIGLWKGSGLSIVLDLLAASLAEGDTTANIGTKGGVEYGVSQVFIAMNLYSLTSKESIEQLIDETIEELHASSNVDGSETVRYPGEGTWERRKENLEKGIPVEEEIWETILAL
jgi:3-dehydro-L-gulonate 2-dehydrogenase